MVHFLLPLSLKVVYSYYNTPIVLRIISESRTRGDFVAFARQNPNFAHTLDIVR